MGADIYLNSVWEPFFAEYERRTERRRREPSETYEAFRSSGGYFRNAYNSSDIMWAMGLSWRHVQTMLDAEHRLPIERARDLLALIETRPLTP